MQTLNEINKLLQIEEARLQQLYVQLKKSNETIDQLENKRKKLTEFNETDIDKWLHKRFGICNQRDAKNNCYIIFDNTGQFVQVVKCRKGNQFEHVTNAENINDKNTLQGWLIANNLHGQNALAFCNQHKEWYALSLKDQLKSLGWKLTETKNTIPMWI